MSTGRHEALKGVVRALEQSRRVLVTAHPSPDGDALGSMVAATIILQGMGREVVAYNPDPVPRRFRFLAGTEKIQRRRPGKPFDTTLLLDCSSRQLFSGTRLEHAILGRVVVVDHHKSPADMGDVVMQDPSAAAVGVMLFEIFTAMGQDLRPAAEALFCSLMSDTGSFRYQNTDSRALHTAASLIDLGVDPWQVASHLYEDRPRCELDLLGLVLQTLDVSEDGLCASLVVTRQMLNKSGCTPDMIDGLINYARGVEGVEVAILLRPGTGGVRVSMRSRGAVDVSRIAATFGGGGHFNAAGCHFDEGSPEEVRQKLFVEISKQLT